MPMPRSSIVGVLLLVVTLMGATATAAPDPVVPVPSDRETTPVATTGDSMDDPAVWVHPTDPSLSLVLGNNKRGALETYDLDGNRVQRLRRLRHVLGQRRHTAGRAGRRRGR